MLIAAFIVLGVALLLGAVLALSYLREGSGAAPSRALAALHGAMALGGLGCLVLAIQGATRGTATGSADFGAIAAVMIALAAAIGGTMLAIHLLRRRVWGVLVAIHASLAIGGFVILAVYLIAG
ncbi:MAG TPA: hypothetical protein VMF53_06765 [Alphaproteobacteria bacterium]|nr:hypothetical protein [Alphaproteobacteria bacterium]